MLGLTLNPKFSRWASSAFWVALAVGLLPVTLLAQHQVVLKNGKTMEARTKPVSMEGQYRFTSADGKFYALPIDQIDLPATEAANRSKDAKAAPAKRFTNDDIASKDTKSPQSSPTTGSSEAKATARDSGLKLKQEMPESGRDESYWRGRAWELHAQIAEVDKQINKLKQEVQEKKSEGIKMGMGTYTPYIVADFENQLGAMQKEKQRLQKEFAGLEEEARKAGAPPGWLR